jgi:hypothetical protein
MARAAEPLNIAKVMLTTFEPRHTVVHLQMFDPRAAFCARTTRSALPIKGALPHA